MTAPRQLLPEAQDRKAPAVLNVFVVAAAAVVAAVAAAAVAAVVV